jgi:hypothetical protein
MHSCMLMFPVRIFKAHASPLYNRHVVVPWRTIYHCITLSFQWFNHCTTSGCTVVPWYYERTMVFCGSIVPVYRSRSPKCICAFICAPYNSLCKMLNPGDATDGRTHRYYRRDYALWNNDTSDVARIWRQGRHNLLWTEAILWGYSTINFILKTHDLFWFFLFPLWGIYFHFCVFDFL